MFDVLLYEFKADLNGLPVGVSFFGRAFSDAKQLRFAFAFEQATRHRRPPKLLPTAVQ